jgi:FkbM family methyltransferase
MRLFPVTTKMASKGGRALMSRLNIVSIPIIDGSCHSIDRSLLTAGGWVLDAGCRGFCFSRAVAAFGCKVLALDPARDIVDPKLPGVHFLRKALTAKGGRCRYVDTPKKFWNYVVDERLRAEADGRNFSGQDVFKVECLSIAELMASYSIPRFDAVKLDIEGAEYDLLEHWPGAIARQLSVEFHDFYREIFPEGPDYYARALPHLAQWYRCVQNHPYDCLFIERVGHGTNAKLTGAAEKSRRSTVNRSNLARRVPQRAPRQKMR